jgi:hypothetical protein
MKACEHFRSALGDETDITQSDGYPWNCWVTVWEGDKVIYSSFEAGLRWEYLSHLAQHPECCQEIGVSPEEVKSLLEEIEAEWKKAVNP